jgi:hypothetical protein
VELFDVLGFLNECIGWPTKVQSDVNWVNLVEQSKVVTDLLLNFMDQL